jgi:hypothetical protein
MYTEHVMRDGERKLEQIGYVSSAMFVKFGMRLHGMRREQRQSLFVNLQLFSMVQRLRFIQMK